jgi:hypothetical protein
LRDLAKDARVDLVPLQRLRSLITLLEPGERKP